MIHTTGGSVFNISDLFLIIAIKVFLLAGRLLLCSLETLVLTLHWDDMISYSFSYGYFQFPRVLSSDKKYTEGTILENMSEVLSLSR
jgi:hypothetical protein